MKTRERILQRAIELFNQQGTVRVTTNHLAADLEMSPGNLYFHFRNKEEIVREIFVRMCEDTYAVWALENVKAKDSLQTVLVDNFEIYWRYRFFHREMYYLRREDRKLNELWRRHMNKILQLMRLAFYQWQEAQIFRKIQNEEELDFILEVLIVTSSAYLQFFESREKEAKKTRIDRGLKHVRQFLNFYALRSI